MGQEHPPIVPIPRAGPGAGRALRQGGRLCSVSPTIPIPRAVSGSVPGYGLGSVLASSRCWYRCRRSQRGHDGARAWQSRWKTVLHSLHLGKEGKNQTHSVGNVRAKTKLPH